MLLDRRNWLPLASLAVLGTLAMLQHWLVDRRPAPTGSRAAHEFLVISSEDKGPGSLREAIFAVDTADGRARIELRTKRIVVTSPLPPIVNPHGVVIEASKDGTEIDARGLAYGPVLDIDAGNSSLTGVAIRNAPEQGVLLRAGGFQLRSANIENCDEGLHVADGIRNVLVEENRFSNNRVGIILTSSEPGIVLRNNQFAGHRDAAVWAVRREFDKRAARMALVQNNRFQGDRNSLVLANAPVTVESNEFWKPQEAALFLIGQGAVVRKNRIRDGAGAGIIADGTQGSVIEANELDHNSGLAILVRSSRNTLVQSNRVHGNGYGIAFVLGEAVSPSIARENILLGQHYDGIVVIGDSPVLKRNQVLNSRSAGLRLLDFFPLKGAKVSTHPFLEGNVWKGNSPNDPVPGEYRVKKAK